MSKADRTTWREKGYIWLIYTRDDGRVSTCGPLDPDCDKGMVIERYLPPGATNIHWETIDNIPQDREYRDAWVMDENKKITIHLEKAKEIHAERLAIKASIKLNELDAELMKARVLGEKNAINILEKEKEQLMAEVEVVDVASAQSVDELKSVSIGILNGKQE